MRKLVMIISIMLIAVLLASCKPQATPTPTPAPTGGNTVTDGTGGTTGDTTANTFDTSKGFTDSNGCYDSEGGRLNEVRGYIIDAAQKRYEDNCTGSMTLKEYYCGQIGYKDEMSVSCPGGCQDGACLPYETSPEVCRDTDFKTYEEVGTVSYQGKTFTDTCKDDKYVIEYFCTDVGIQTQVEKYCTGGCKDGACVVVTTDSTSSCSDSDLGEGQEFTKGMVTDPKGTIYDVCMNTGTVTEYKCNSIGYRTSINVACANGCVDGACTK